MKYWVDEPQTQPCAKFESRNNIWKCILMCVFMYCQVTLVRMCACHKQADCDTYLQWTTTQLQTPSFQLCFTSFNFSDVELSFHSQEPFMWDWKQCFVAENWCEIKSHLVGKNRRQIVYKLFWIFQRKNSQQIKIQSESSKFSVKSGKRISFRVFIEHFMNSRNMKLKAWEWQRTVHTIENVLIDLFKIEKRYRKAQC